MNLTKKILFVTMDIASMEANALYQSYKNNPAYHVEVELIHPDRIAGIKPEYLIIDDVDPIPNQITEMIIAMNKEHDRFIEPNRAPLKYHERFNTGAIPKLRKRR